MVKNAKGDGEILLQNSMKCQNINLIPRKKVRNMEESYSKIAGMHSRGSSI